MVQGSHRLRLFIWKDRLRSMNLDALLVNNDSVDLVRFFTSLSLINSSLKIQKLNKNDKHDETLYISAFKFCFNLYL